MKSPNGWARIIVSACVLASATIIQLAPHQDPTAMSAFYAVATLIVYSVFHIGEKPPPAPPTGTPGGAA